MRLAWGLVPFLAVAAEPVHFEPGPDGAIISRSGGMALRIDRRGASFTVSRRDGPPPKPGSIPRHPAYAHATVRMVWEGGSDATPVAMDRQAGVSHYLPGPDRATWRLNVHRYSRAKLAQVYPGIDLVFYGNGPLLEYDFVVAPGADPGQVRLRFDGADGVHVDPRLGDLVLQTSLGEVRQHRPRVYQRVDGRDVEVAAAFVVERGRVGFQLARYDRTKPLVIDPTLLWSTLVGGSGADSGGDVASDASGASYLVGTTQSTDFPVRTPLQPTATSNPTAFITKLNAAGTAIEWSTYFGTQTAATAVAVDGAGSVYVAGTVRGSIPLANQFQTTIAGEVDGFVAKLAPNGASLAFCTYIGGANDDTPTEIGVDGNLNVYIAGITNSLNYPTLNAQQTLGAPTAFVTKFVPAGNALDYSTKFLFAEAGFSTVAMTVDQAGNAYLVGGASTGVAPTTNAVQATNAGGSDAFLIRYNPRTSGNVAIGYATWLGGNGDDYALGVAERAGNILVVGYTQSTNFPLRFPFQTTPGGGIDAFAARLNVFGLLHSTYLGGGGADYGIRAAITAQREAYIAGQTSSSNFPEVDAVAPRGSGVDAFLTRLDEIGSVARMSTTLGGSGQETLNGLAVGPTSIAHLAGETASSNFPLVRSLQTLTGPTDAFLSRISPCTTISVSPTTETVPAAGGSRTITVNADSQCPWSVSVPTWIVITGTSGSVTFSVSPNSGPARTGVVMIGGLVVTVNQDSGLGNGTAPISAPNIDNPLPDEFVRVPSVLFSWTPVGGADNYDLRIFTDTGSLVFSGNVAGAGVANTVIDLRDGAYLFLIRGCLGTVSDPNCGAFSSRRFLVGAAAPIDAPIIQQPAQGARLTTSLQSFSWTGIAGATRYEVLLEDSGVPEYQTATTELGTSYSLRTSNNYRLRVRGCSSGCGSWSPAVTFTAAIGSVSAQNPASIRPPLVVSGNQVTVNINAAQNADFHRVLMVQSGTGPGGGAITVASGVTTGGAATLSVPQGPVTAFVAGCTGNGCGNNSSGVSANVPGPSPSAPTLSFPIPGSTVDGPTLTFTWNRIPGDNGSNTVYRLYVQDVKRLAPALDVFTTNNFYGAFVLAEGTRYDALVIANPGASQVAGPSVSFNVRGTSATAPTMVRPPHNSSSRVGDLPGAAPGNVVIGWSPVTGATLYQYFVALAGQIAPVASGVTPGLLVQVPIGPVGGVATTYNGIVRACLGGGCTPDSDSGWGPWSNQAGGSTTFTLLP